MQGKGLGRWSAPDERDEKYLLRALTGTPRLDSLATYKYWHSPACLDQGNVPQCVGYSTKTMLINSPARQTGTSPTPKELYDYAQRNDEWPGEDYGGTSIRAGMKAAVHYGKVTEYRWAFTLEDVVTWLLTNGTLVLGTTWTSGMSQPHRGKDGRSWIEPTGAYEGGHAYSLNGVNRTQRKVRVLNNWGRSYGDDGFVWMSFDSLEYLLQDHGEAACPVEKS